jgi:CheY-like chemotaxis protein
MKATKTRDPSGLEMREIMVVEPDDETRGRISHFLHRSGARVTTAASVDEAIHLVCLGVYDVVVIGTFLPDMNEQEFVHSIKSLAPWTLAVPLTEALNTTSPEAEDRILEIIRTALSLFAAKAGDPR